jgi:hypothetical protein
LYPETVDVLALHVSSTECCTGATPVPDSGIVAGDPVALLVTVMLPGMLPTAVGLNCTTRVMLCVGVSVTGAPPPVIE